MVFIPFCIVLVKPSVIFRSGTEPLPIKVGSEDLTTRSKTCSRIAFTNNVWSAVVSLSYSECALYTGQEIDLVSLTLAGIEV